MKFNQFIDTIRKQLQDEDFHGAIHIAQDDETIFANAYGYANRTEKITNRIDTSFAIASGTKFFTALAAGCLIEDGKLSLDTKVFDVIEHNLDPSLYDPNITVKHIMSHTSGMPDYIDEYLDIDFDNFELSVPNHKLIRPFDYFPAFPNREKKFEPGTRFAYCNGAYIVLSAVVEALGESTFQEFVENRILKPLNMKSSGFYKMNALPNNTALGYINDNGHYRTNIYDVPIIGGGDGGMFTSTTDMFKFWRNLYQNNILSKDLKEAFFTPQIAMDEAKTKYTGLGHFIRKVDGGYARFISGGDAGVSFESCYHEPHNVQYTVISNTSNSCWSMANLINEALS